MKVAEVSSLKFMVCFSVVRVSEMAPKPHRRLLLCFFLFFFVLQATIAIEETSINL